MTDQNLGLYVDADSGQFVTCTDDAVRQNKAGALVTLQTREGERKYRYMKAQETFAAGQVSELYQFIDNADVDAAQAITTKVLKGTGDFVAGEFNDGTFPSSYVSIDANTGAMQTRAIERNVGSTDFLTLDKNWDVALDTTSDYVTYDINYVRLADTDNGVPIVMGIAIGVVTAGNWGWFQVGGFCPMVRQISSTDALVAGESIVASATAGACRGLTNGGTTADEVAQAFGRVLHASAAAEVAGAGAAVLLAMPWAC